MSAVQPFSTIEVLFQPKIGTVKCHILHVKNFADLKFKTLSLRIFKRFCRLPFSVRSARDSQVLDEI